MALFLSSFTNKIDKKGRISVPASFRNVLAAESFSGIVVYNSFINPCIEACGISRIEKISDAIDDLDPFSESRDAFATALLGGSMQLPFDGEGRIILPENLIDNAQIQDNAIFVGKGKTFEIWQPSLFEEYFKKSQQMAKEKRGHLSFVKNNKNGDKCE